MCRKSGGQVLTCQTSEFLLSIARAFIGAFGRLVVTSFDDSLFSITTSRVKPAIHSVYDSIYCNRKLLLQQTTRRCARQVCKTRGRENKNPMKTSAKTGLCGVFCSPCQWLTMHRAPTRSSRLLPAATQPTLQTMSKCRMPYILRHNHGANRNPKCHSSIRHETQAEKRGMRSTIHGPCKWGVRGMVHGSCKKGER